MIRLLVLLTLTGCTHIRMLGLYSDIYNPVKQQYLELHQCKLPITVSMGEMSEEDATRIRAGLKFWEHYVGRSLFVESNPAQLIFKDTDESYHGAMGAYIKREWDSEGCITFSKIVFMYPLASLAEWQQDFIIRHETGHSLGLDDSDNQFHIMYRFVGLNVQKPSEYEIQALRRHYGP